VVEVVVLVVILVYLSVAPPLALLFVGMSSKLFLGAVADVEGASSSAAEASYTVNFDLENLKYVLLY
jgi:hypothetical protein